MFSTEPEIMFANKLVIAIYEKGFSYSQFSMYMDVDYKTACSWIHGDRMPNAKYLRDICRKLDVSADWLLSTGDYNLDEIEKNDKRAKNLRTRKGGTRRWKNRGKEKN